VKIANTNGVGTFTSLSDSGNLAFTGTGNRITGDFTNATVANRVMFQTSTSNSATVIGVIPSGTGTASYLALWGNASATNTNVTQLGSDGSIASGQVGSGTYLPMTFYTGGSERMRVDTSGNVGIGTTSPASKFNVVDTGTGANTALIQSGQTGTTVRSNTVLRVQTTAAGRDVNIQLSDNVTNSAEIGMVGGPMYFATAGVERMRIDSSGNVGIGTGSPSSKLQVSGTLVGNILWGNANNTDTTAGSGAGFFGSNGAVNAVMYASSSAACGFYGTSTNHPIIFLTNNTERARIDTSGNVGVGTNSPSTYGKIVSVTGDNATAFAAVGATNMLRIQGYNSTYSGTVIEAVNLAQSASTPLFINASQTLFATGAVERMRIGPSGQIGLSGANYGTSGQVLTSQGSSSAPIWSAAGVGSGQSWTDVSGSRANGTTYTNSTGKPIQVNIYVSGGNLTTATLNVSSGTSVLVAQTVNATGNPYGLTLTAIIPNSATYILGGSMTVGFWCELR